MIVQEGYVLFFEVLSGNNKGKICIDYNSSNNIIIYNNQSKKWPFYFFYIKIYHSWNDNKNLFLDKDCKIPLQYQTFLYF